MAPNGEWDVLNWRMGMALPISLFDADAITALLDDPYTGASKIDQLILAWDGEPFVTWDIVKLLCRQGGYFPGVTHEGRITFAKLRLATIADAASNTVVTPIPRTLDMEHQEGERLDRLIGRIGVLPWSDGQPYEVNASGATTDPTPTASQRAGILGAREEEITLDFPNIRPATVEWSAAVSPLVSIAKFRSLGAPILTIDANDGDYSHGDMLRVGDPGLEERWFVDVNGSLISVDSSARWFGQVIGFRKDYGRGRIQLRLILSNYHLNKFIRLRPPAARISSVAAAVYTVAANDFTSADDALYSTDAAAFTVGDYVEVWGPDGTLVSGTTGAPDVQQITAISGNDITLDAAWTTTPSSGDIIRLAHLDDVDGSPETDSALFAGFRAHVWLAEDDGTLGPNNIDADIYGFGSI